MDQHIALWAGLAIFLGPILAGAALVFLRWQMDRGPWWTWLVLIGAGVLGYFGYQRTSAPPSTLSTHTRQAVKHKPNPQEQKDLQILRG